jgi:hypothetical protein
MEGMIALLHQFGTALTISSLRKPKHATRGAKLSRWRFDSYVSGYGCKNEQSRCLERQGNRP